MNMGVTSLDKWESMWAPYDAELYAEVLQQIAPDDHILDIGAGDLRLGLQLARRSAKVYALEINWRLLQQAAKHLPANLNLLVGDARFLPFPKDVTTAVLLMRHCTHFSLYFDKLRATNCRTLLTNARWGLGLEVVDLRAARPMFEALDMGWYACRCGHAGFKSGPPQFLDERNIDLVSETDSCPVCQAARGYAGVSAFR